MEVINTNSLTYTILLILCRTILFSLKAQENGTGMVAMAAPESSGICKSMVETNGYYCEEHWVITQDGYILNMLRIPMGRSGGFRATENRPTVLLQCGLFMDGVTWLLLPPEKSLAFNLADNGYDVWFVSSRGTRFSRGHTSLSPDDPAYWDWTWDELVAYDLPATFEYVYDETGQNLHYVGHSLGALMIMAAVSNGQLLNMLRSVAVLSPIAYMGHTSSPLSRFTADYYIFEALYRLGHYKFEMNFLLLDILKIVCRIPMVDCTNLFTPYTGQNCCLKPSIVNTFLDHEPQPSAMKLIIHMSQMIRRGTLTMYDYGDDRENTRHYGEPTLPAYNLTNIPKDLPIFFGYGGADALADVTDVELLLDCLKGHDRDKIEIQYKEGYGHADYVMAEKAKEDVYDPLIAFFGETTLKYRLKEEDRKKLFLEF